VWPTNSIGQDDYRDFVRSLLNPASIGLLDFDFDLFGPQRRVNAFLMGTEALGRNVTQIAQAISEKLDSHIVRTECYHTDLHSLWSA
jgi:hypothetical protein